MNYSINRPRRNRHKRSWRWVAITVLAVAALIAAATAFLVLRGGEPARPAATRQQPPQPQKLRVEGRYLFNGGVSWARFMQDWSKNADGTLNYAYPFSGLNTFDRAAYDAWTAELECPSFIGDIPVERQNRETAFNCRPEFFPEAAKFFDFFNLANNHTRDYKGEAALTESRQHLEANGLQHWGDFEPGKLENACEVMALPVRIISTLGGRETSEKGSLPVAFCAWHYFFRLPQPGEIEVMKQYADVMPVFAFIQAGVEYRPKADSYQRMMAHKAADQGPEFVVMNSAHWVQDGEVYKGIPILYATGNFVFDQQFDSEVTRSVSLDGSMTIDYSPELDKWLALGASCKAQKDDCFEQIKTQGLKKPRLSFAYDLVAGDNSNKLTKRANDRIQASVEERVGWTAIKTALEQ